MHPQQPLPPPSHSAAHMTPLMIDVAHIILASEPPMEWPANTTC